MDDVKPPPKRFDDVARPGDTPASASSIPVIVGNQTVQSDPMMTPTGSQSPQNAQPFIPVQPPMSARNTPVDLTSGEAQDTGGSSDVSLESETKVSSDMTHDNNDQVSLESVHKIRHENAFFGEMKPPMSRFKKVLIFILIVTIMGAIGFGAWYLSNPKKEEVQPAPTVTTPVVEEPTVKRPAIPTGYITFNSEDYGYSFNYPKEYGKFTKQPLALSNTEQQNQIRLQSEIPAVEYAPGIVGQFVIETSSSDDQEVKIDKFSPSVKLVDGKWIVVTANEMDASKNKVGQEYLDYNKKVVASQKNDNITVYTFTALYEGNYTTLLVFNYKNVLHNIFLPGFSDGGMQGNTTLNDKTQYDTLVKNVRDSIYAN